MLVYLILSQRSLKLPSLKNLKKIYYFGAVLGLCCCTAFSLISVRRHCSLVVLYGLLIAVASLVAERWLLGWADLSSCVSWSLEHRLDTCGTRA